MKYVLVTGSNGFVGRHFVKRLVEDGCFVCGVDDLSSGIPTHEWSQDIYGSMAGKFQFTHGDCREFFGEIKAGEFDTIYHCAAVVGGRQKIEGDPLAVAIDLSIDSEFFRWATTGPLPRKVIYFSSSAVYPVENQTRDSHCDLYEALVNFRSNSFGRPDFTYGWAKLSGEYLAQVAAERYGLPVVIYRPFSGYGEDQSFDYPFPSLIKRALKGDNPFLVWGSGEQRRDWIHINDVIEVVLQTQDKLLPGGTLNLGWGKPLSFRALIRGIHEVLGKPQPAIVPVANSPEGVFSRVAGTRLLAQYYQPKITLEEGIRRVAAHLDKSLERV